MDILHCSHRRVVVPSLDTDNLMDLVPEKERQTLVENDKVTFVDVENNILALTKYNMDTLKLVKRGKPIYGVPLKNLLGQDNVEQMYFLEDFFNPEIYLHVLTGNAGTGKNFIAALASLYFARIKNSTVIYTKDPIEMGRRLGFLPGTMDEKIEPYIRPILDTVLALNEYKFNYEFDRLVKDGFLQICPVQTLRGSNLTDVIGIFDECQNEDVFTMQGYISRFKTPGSKVILLGSFKQIDLAENRKLENSGLYHVLHAFRGWKHYSHVHLVDNMRGSLAQEADSRLPFRF